jgi:two-component system nitrogen regulation response regulator NtrX
MASVLVVEDSADLRDMYLEILSLDGHAVRAAETAAEAIAAIGAERPAVVVLDLGIAGGVAELLATLGPGPQVILASGARDLPERAAALGAAFLLKPFAPEQLLAAVADAAKR